MCLNSQNDTESDRSVAASPTPPDHPSINSLCYSITQPRRPLTRSQKGQVSASSPLRAMPNRLLQGKKPHKRLLASSSGVNNPPPSKRIASNESNGSPNGTRGSGSGSPIAEPAPKAATVAQRTGETTRPARPTTSPVRANPSSNGPSLPPLNPRTEGTSRLGSPSQATPPTTMRSIDKMLTECEKRLMKHFVSQQRVTLTKLTALEEVLSEIPSSITSLKAEVSDLKMMLLPTCNGPSMQRTNSRSPGTRPRNKTKISTLEKEVIVENPTLLAELNIVFNTDISCTATAKAISHQLDKFQRKTETVSITSRLMNAMLYGLRKDMPKAAWKEGIGFRHAELRFRTLKFMLAAAKSLPEKLFTPEERDDYEALHGASNSSKPTWLTSDVVRSSELTLARKQYEFMKSELPDDPIDPDKRQSLYIAMSFMKVIIDMLRQSREKSRVRMFEDGVCCLLDWECFEWFPKDLTNSTIAFVWTGVNPVSPSDIPECVVGDINDVRDLNSDLLRTLMAERKDMIVECLYEVHIRNASASNGRKRKALSSETKSLRRFVNILRVSTSFLCGFCHLNEDQLLATHASMLKSIYRFALVLREMFVKKAGIGGESDDGMRDGRVAARADIRTGSTSHVAENSAEMRDNGTNTHKETPRITILGLLPSDSDILRILQNTVSLSPETYDKINKPTDNYADAEDAVDCDELPTLSVRDEEVSESEDDDLYDMVMDDE